MEQLLKIVGNTTVEWVVIAIAAVVFLTKVYHRIEKYFSDKALAEKWQDDRIQAALDQATLYSQWHQQILDIQQNFTGAIDELQAGQERQNKRLEKMEKERQQRELNKLRDRILQSYRYYTSTEKNPLLAWSAMEADAFWRLLKDYEDLGGDGYVHSDVQPSMNSMTVVRMDDAEGLSRLMRSRK